MLASPDLDISGREGVRLQFRYWVAVEDGAYDRAVVDVNGEEVWRNPTGGGDAHHMSGYGALADMPVEGDTASIQFKLLGDDAGSTDASPAAASTLQRKPGCGAVGSAASSWWVALLLVAAGRRRRGHG